MFTRVSGGLNPDSERERDAHGGNNRVQFDCRPKVFLNLRDW